MTIDPPERASASPPGMPTWVKGALIIAALAVILVIFAMVAGGGQHGPQRHGSGANQPPITTAALVQLQHTQ